MQATRQIVLATSRPARRWHYAANLVLAGLLASGAAQLFIAGDGARYDGLLVALGWALALIGWRTFAHRNEPIGNPARHFVEGLGIVATVAAHFVLRLVSILILLLLAVGLLALAERFSF